MCVFKLRNAVTWPAGTLQREARRHDLDAHKAAQKRMRSDATHDLTNDASTDLSADIGWDDDDFEVPVLRAEPTRQQDTQDEDMAWMMAEDATAAASGTDAKSQRAGEAGSRADKHTSDQARAVLNTPASRKKPRCAECTRPLNTLEDRLCSRCAPSQAPLKSKSESRQAWGIACAGWDEKH